MLFDTIRQINYPKNKTLMITNQNSTRLNSKYKLILLLFMMYITGKGMYAQVTIGDETPPRNFSILELISNKSGLRLPQLTTAERNALAGTAGFQSEKHRGDATHTPGLGLGLVIYNTETNSTEYWNGYKWISLRLGTADIELESSSGNYDPQNPPVETAGGVHSGRVYTPEDKPACTVPSGKAYDVYLTAGSAYATLTVDDLTSAFSVGFLPNNSSLPRNAIVRVVNNCTGEFKDFIFSQEGATCPSAASPVLNENNLSLCPGGSVFAHVTDPVQGVDYIWTFSGVIVHTGNWYEIKRPGTYKVWTGLLGCGTPAELNVTENNSSYAPSEAMISATNGGLLCSGGSVILTANTANTVLWYHDGAPLTGADKNNNPLTLTGASAAGRWFAVVWADGCVSGSGNILTLIDNTASSKALPTPEALVNGQLLTGGSLVVCKEGTLKLEITNAADYPADTEYEWFNNGLSIGKGTDPIMYVVAPNTTHMALSVTAGDRSGSCPNTAVSQKTDVSITAPNATSINNGALQAAICGVAPATLIADYTEAAEYEWLLNKITVAGAKDQTYQTTQTGNYTVRYKDSNGCWSKESTTIQVVQSAPITMTWNPVPTDVIKDETQTYSIIANPKADRYRWSYTSADPTAVISVTPIEDGSSAIIKYGSPSSSSTDVTIEVKSVGHPCGDAVLKKIIAVKDGCVLGTSVNLTPNGNISMTEGSTQNFLASTNASNNSNDLRYEWFVNNMSQGAASADETFAYTPAGTGSYTVSVRVTNNCTASTDNVTAQANVTVKPDFTAYTPDTGGDFKLTGKDCYDVAQSNFSSTCGIQSQRPGDFLNGSRQWVEDKQWVYTFTANTTVTDLQFVTDDPSVLLKTETSNTGSDPYTHTLIFDQSVLTKAYGTDKTHALTITVYALFKVSGQNKRVEQKISVQDCWCGCGAYVAKDQWKVFMCHNLGADETADPFTPDKKLNGDYYQWGRKSVAAYGPLYSTPNAVNGTWNTTYAPNNSWSDASKNQTNDPCPEGFRVPTIAEWKGVVDTNLNLQTSVGSTTWANSVTNFSTGRKVGDNLYLPAAGYRDYKNGSLSGRGSAGSYWSSTQDNNSRLQASYLNLLDANRSSVSLHDQRTMGFSVRCIAE
jgi:uncharacterized protein (TIGR02145 family)